MTRDTSLEAYKKIKENGMLGKRKMEIYDVVFRHGPLTANEAFNILKLEKYRNLNFDSNTNSRFTELRDCGCLQEVGKKKCKITGNTVILWDVTKSLPVKMEKPKRQTCCACKGRGYVETQQAKLF